MTYMTAAVTDTRNGFGTRLKKVQRKHARMARGYHCKVSRDGLIVFKAKRRKPGVPWRGLTLTVMGFLFFKGVVMAHMGDATYASRVAEMSRGSTLDRAGAAVMQADPVSEFVAQQLRPLL